MSQAVRKKLMRQYRKMQEIHTRMEYLRGLNEQLKSGQNEFRRSKAIDLRDSPMPRNLEKSEGRKYVHSC